MKEILSMDGIAEVKAILKNNSLSNKYGKLGIVLLKIIVLCGFVYFIATNIDFTRFINSFKSADLIFLSFAFLLLFVNIFLQYKKWELICTAFEFTESKRTVLTSLLFGLASGILTPARVGEYVGRKIILKNSSLAKVTSATIVDKFFPTFILLIFGFPVFLYFLKLLSYINSELFTSSLTFYLILLFSVSSFLVKNKTKSASFINRIISFVSRGKYDIEIFKGINKRVLSELALLSTLFFVCYTVQFALLFSAFSISISFLICLIVACTVMFFKSFIPQISIADLGIREGAAIFLFTKIGGTAEAALNASLFIFLINFILPSLMGVIISHTKTHA